MLLCMPGLPKIPLLDMDFLFLPILFSNSMPKTLYPKTNKSFKLHKLLMSDY